MYQKSQSYDVQLLSYGVRQAEFFVILGHFLPFQPPDNLENQNFKIKKNTWRYYHFTHVYHKWQSYDVWFLRYEAWWTEFFVILDCFLPFYRTNNPKNQNFEKLKKTPGDIILHMSTINYNHMMYGSWDIGRDRQIFVILEHFLPIYPLKTQRIKILKKWKKRLEILSFYTSVLTIIIMCYTVPEIWHVTDVIVFLILDYFLPFYPINCSKNENFKKIHLEILSFYTCVP